MYHSVSKDEFKNETYHYIKSNLTSPNKPLSFPYENTKSSLVVGCKEKSHYWVYVVFNEVNLIDGGIGDGYNTYNIEVKAKDEFHNFTVTQKFGSKFLSFNMLKIDKKNMKYLISSNDELWIQFNHYQNGKRFYKYDTKGFQSLFDKNCKI